MVKEHQGFAKVCGGGYIRILGGPNGIYIDLDAGKKYLVFFSLWGQRVRMEGSVETERY